MKFRVKRASFKAPIPCLGSSAWMEGVKQGGVAAVEYDNEDRMLLLDAPKETIRVPVEAVLEIVLGATQAKAATK